MSQQPNNPGEVEVFLYEFCISFNSAAVKMAKTGKKGKGKKKKVTEEDPNALTEVDKTFYELTIADLNRKLARLRSLTQELEQKNEDLNQNLEKLDEDKSDIITYLKRTLQEKANEINELEERITGLQEIRQTETERFEAKIADMEQEYKQMHEQLTSENKLLEGKLNSLEEFRSQRDDLMKKFEEQEKKMELQEKRHAREMYEIERKFIISKDKLKKDMEARLLQLSTEFHDASELRIAATTHRVIRENIAVNNELDNMLRMHQKLYKDYNNIKANKVTLKQDAELHDAEKKKALAKVLVQRKIIEKITSNNEFIKNELAKYKKYEIEVRETRRANNDKQSQIEKLEFKIRLLEQNFQKIKCDNYNLQTEVSYLRAENVRLDDVLLEGVSCIKEALTIKTESDTSIKYSRRESLLNALFSLLCKGHERKIKQPSLDTISSTDATYALGDLGFVPQPVQPRPVARTLRNISSQVGESFEEFLIADLDETVVKKSYADKTESELYMPSEEDVAQSQHEIETKEEQKKPSILFFDEQEAPAEESDGDSETGDVEDYEESEDQGVKSENTLQEVQGGEKQEKTTGELEQDEKKLEENDEKQEEFSK